MHQFADSDDGRVAALTDPKLDPVTFTVNELKELT
jgi:hypothetical protein